MAQEIRVMNLSSYSWKAGFAGEDSPRAVFPAVIGRFRNSPIYSGMGMRPFYVGDEAQERSSIMHITRPVTRGYVTDYEDLELIIDQAYHKELNASSHYFPLFLTDFALSTNAHRELLAKILFEKFSVPSLFIASSAIACVLATGKLSGLSIESGDTVTQVAAVHEGQLVPESALRINFGGADVTQYLFSMLQSAHPGSYFRKRSLMPMKETLAIVRAKNHAEENIEAMQYTLPDGEVISVRNERYQCTEPYFDPSLLHLENAGLHHLIRDSIQRCDSFHQSSLYQSIVVSGGSTLFSGMQERIEQELRGIVPPSTEVQLLAREDLQWRRFREFVGASMWASQSTFLSQCITKAEFAEEGERIIGRKCF